MVNSNLAYKFQEVESEIDYTYLPDELKYTSVSLTDIFKNKLRLEASAFSIDSKIAKDKILNCKYGFTSITGDLGICKAYRPGIIKRNFVEKRNGIPMFTPSQITDLYPKPYKFLSKEQSKNLNDWVMVEGELALTCSGTVGKTSMVSKTLSGKVFSQNMIRLCNSDYLGYIYAFLQTNEGQSIITSNNYGAVIQHIDPDHLDNVIIPNAPNELKKEIHELIIESYNLRDESKELIDHAEKILYEELQLKSLDELRTEYFDDTKDLRNYTTKLSDSRLRFDGSYHIPIVQMVENEIKQHAKEITTIGQLSKNVILAGVFKRTYVDRENGVPFLGGRDITQLNPKVEKFLSRSVHEKRIKKELEVFENYILISDRGTIGKVQIVPKHWNGWAVSQNIIKVITQSNDIAGYLFCFFNSEYGQILIKRETYGSVVDMIDDKNISGIHVPLLKNEKKQKEINDSVLRANECRYQAHLKEQEAITKMKHIINDSK